MNLSMMIDMLTYEAERATGFIRDIILSILSEYEDLIP